MKISRLKILYSALNIALFISVLFIGLTASQPPFNPWLDVTDDGYGGIDDIVSTAEHFGASGDPTKLCNITNWPSSTSVLVWDLEHLVYPTSSSAYAGPFNASGFSRLHILYQTFALGGTDENLTIYIRANLVGTVIVCKLILTSTNSSGYFTMLVPWDKFSFSVQAGVTTDCYLDFGFYLSWN